MENKVPLLTLQEKTLVHLIKYKGLEDCYEYPLGVTQKGIAECIGAHRKHMPRILKKLLEDDLITEDRGRVKESSQSMKVYLLTWGGISKANQVKKFAEECIISVSDENGKISPIKICQINNELKSNYTLLEIINNISLEGVFDCLSFNKEGSEPVDEMPAKQEIYWHTLLQVWKDGQASTDEAEILGELRKLLDISDKDHMKMQDKIIRCASPVRKRLLEVYSFAYEEALKDEEITEEERRMLEALREKLNIDKDEQERIESDFNGNSSS